MHCNNPSTGSWFCNSYLLYWSLDQSGVILVFFYPSVRNHIQQGELWGSQPFFYQSGAVPTRLFK